MTATVPHVLVTTSLPSPYQVELFDALAASGCIHLNVLYERLSQEGRSWSLPEIHHEFHVLQKMTPFESRRLIDSFDLVIFSGYQKARLRELIRARANNCRPWCFWGERPGYHLPQWLGQRYRAMILPELARRDIPIWGMGDCAVSAYRREFGPSRFMANIPYFSRLDQFLAIDRVQTEEPPHRILFSGSLIKRKGVDILMKAFLAVADQHPTLELHIIGTGPLEETLRQMSGGNADRVHFHGFRQWNELPRYYAEADILCAPSRYDGWGLIVPEGLAAGLLVIATDRTGAAIDLISPDVGWVVQANRFAPLVDALRAAVSIRGAERANRIARGRSVATAQDVSAGVPRFLEAVEQTFAAFRAIGASPPSSR